MSRVVILRTYLSVRKRRRMVAVREGCFLRYVLYKACRRAVAVREGCFLGYILYKAPSLLQMVENILAKVVLAEITLVSEILAAKSKIFTVCNKL